MVETIISEHIRSKVVPKKKLISYIRSIRLTKKKNKSGWKDYKTFTLKDGTKFLARDEHDAKLYRQKVGDE